MRECTLNGARPKYKTKSDAVGGQTTIYEMSSSNIPLIFRHIGVFAGDMTNDFVVAQWAAHVKAVTVQATS